MASFGAQYVVYEDSGFLSESVWRVYPLMDKIVFLVGMRPWRGDAAGSKYWAQTLATIAAMPDPDGKFVIVSKPWSSEAEQRNEGVSILRELGCDWCMTIDDDELYNRSQLAHAQNVIRSVVASTHVSAWLVHHAIYWKSRELVIEQLTSAMPVFVHTRANDITFTEARCFDSSRGAWLVLPASDLVMHHMSYVRDDEHMKRKMATFSHAGQESSDWYDRVWKAWRPGMRNLHPNEHAAETFSRAIPANEFAHQLEPKPEVLRYDR